MKPCRRWPCGLIPRAWSWPAASPPTCPTDLIGDSGRLRQVIVNLVGNAIKFTERGEVVAAVSVEESSDAAVTLRIAVADTGIGIPRRQAADHLSTVRAGGRVDDSALRRHGPGADHLAQARRADGRARSRSRASRGEGSTFCSRSRWACRLSTTLTPPSQHLSQLEGLHVLIVDDNATNRLILTEVLTNWGMRPTAVDGGRAALGRAAQAPRTAASRIPIALIDGMMPEMDGFDLAEQIRREPEIAAVRLLLLTSAGQPDDTARCRALAISVLPDETGSSVRALRRLDQGNDALEPVRGDPSPAGACPGASDAAAPSGALASRLARRGSSRESEGGRPHARASGSQRGRRARTAPRRLPPSKKADSTSS